MRIWWRAFRSLVSWGLALVVGTIIGIVIGFGMVAVKLGHVWVVSFVMGG